MMDGKCLYFPQIKHIVCYCDQLQHQEKKSMLNNIQYNISVMRNVLVWIVLDFGLKTTSQQLFFWDLISYFSFQ